MFTGAMGVYMSLDDMNATCLARRVRIARDRRATVLTGLAIAAAAVVFVLYAAFGGLK